MRTGILTFQQTSNYGAMLQAYALWTQVKEAGHEAEIIDYRPIRSTLEYTKCMLRSRYAFRRISQYRKMQRLLPRAGALSQKSCITRRRLRREAQKYDLLIAGSDEIWNLEKSYIGLDPSYFLDFAHPDTIKASYAASFGSTSALGTHEKEVSGYLNRFDFIGVRDANSAALVEACGKTPVVVLDPTLLADYSALEMPRLVTRPYLLLYAYRMTEEERRFVRFAAKEKGLMIVSAGNRDACADVNAIDVSVEEWVTLYKHASYVVTSYFHGAIFSMVYRKPFNVLTKPNKTVKINDLLGKAGLESRVLNSLPYELQTQGVDYDEVFRALEPWLRVSRRYLQDVLESVGDSAAYQDNF